MTEKPYVRLSAIEFQEVIKIYSENKHLKQTIEKLKKENEELRLSPRVESIELEALICENEELKHECNYLQNRLDDFINVQNENEKLKHDKQQCHQAMSKQRVKYCNFRDKVFDLIDKKIKYCNAELKTTVGGDYKNNQIIGQLDILNWLREELIDDY